jgi:hypothetical protein
MLMCAHAAFDLTALAMIYWRLEAFLQHIKRLMKRVPTGNEATMHVEFGQV